FYKDRICNSKLNSFLDVLKKYATFSGRARRKEYWMFVLINAIVVMAISLIEYAAGTNGIIGYIYVLALIIPMIAVTVRRLHDIGKSGFWYFICLIPLIGSIWLLVLLCTDSQPGQNQFGANLKGYNN
ncbi:DUF805 domain-containing protein, partial [Clostridioides difficile]